MAWTCAACATPGSSAGRRAPGGGTTDYAVEIFHAALKEGRYTCFLAEDQALPMMYMPDALRATMELMEAPAESVRERGSYNLAGIELHAARDRRRDRAPRARLHDALRTRLPPGNRGDLAAIRSTTAAAQRDWGWRARYDLEETVDDMLDNLREARG